MDKKSVRPQLETLALGNEKYASFNKKIVNTEKVILGVRTPDMRKFAKKLALEIQTQAEIADFFDQLDQNIYEEVYLAGLLINYSKSLTVNEKLELTKLYLPLVDSWALIDGFAEKFPKKMPEEDRQKYWDFALKNLQSEKEFFSRYGVMVLFSNFLKEETISSVFDKIRQTPCNDYYVKMAKAWLYAEAALNFYELTLTEMKDSSIDLWTRKKGLTKMLESRRFTDQQKEEIRALRAGIS